MATWFLASSYWQVRRVRVSGSSDPAILALVRQQRLTGCNAFRCDFSAATRVIAASPRVAHVTIHVVFPDTTLVTIVPRMPALLWRAGSASWLIGADGVLIAPTGVQPPLDTHATGLVNDSTGAGLTGVQLRPGAQMNPAIAAMAKQLLDMTASGPFAHNSLAYSAGQGFTMRSANGRTLIIFGEPMDALATAADLARPGSATPQWLAAHTPEDALAQVAQGAADEASTARAMLARQSADAAPTVIDTRWGGDPFAR